MFVRETNLLGSKMKKSHWETKQEKEGKNQNIEDIYHTSSW